MILERQNPDSGKDGDDWESKDVDFDDNSDPNADTRGDMDFEVDEFVPMGMDDTKVIERCWDEADLL